MKKSLLLIVAIVTSISFSVTAQKEKKLDPKFEKHYKDNKIETDDYSIEIVDAQAQANFSKAKIKITNKTNDYLLIKPDEIEFVFDFGTVPAKKGQLFKKETIIIEPKESSSRVVTADGSDKFQVDNYSINIKGIYKIPSKGLVQQAPDFQIPVSSNQFSAGNFECVMTNSSIETQLTAIKFKCTYKNDAKHVGLVNEGKAVMKIADGREFAMKNSNNKNVVVADGDENKFTVYFDIPAKIVDMQFATMQLVWKDTFRESDIIPMSPATAKMELDEAKTNAGK